MPETVPVKVGEASGALRSKAVCVAVDTGLLASDVLSTLPRPTWVFVTPATVPVNVGESIGAKSASVTAVLNSAIVPVIVFEASEMDLFVSV